MSRNILPLLLILVMGQAVFGQSKNLPKLTADEVISKHLASIGTAEAIAAVKSRVIMAQGTVASKRGYAGSLTGPAQLASDGNKMLIAMIFNSNEFPYEKVAFDGKDQTIGMPNGRRTSLGDFLKSKKSIVRDGLFGGVLSSAWPLLDLKARNARVEYGGTSTVGSRPVYKLKYSPRGDDLVVSLFFDAETFHHVMTEYQYSIDVAIGVSSTDIQSQKDYYTLSEQFGDFKKVGDLVLPFTYMISIDSQANSRTIVQALPGPVLPGNAPLVQSGPSVPNGTGSLYYTLKLSQVYYNEALAGSVFKVS